MKPFIISLFILVVLIGSFIMFSAQNGQTEEDQSHATKITIPVEGMTCSSCSFSIKQQLKRLAGIEACSVSAKKGSATVYFNPEIIGLNKIKEAIEQLGYKVSTP